MVWFVGLFVGGSFDTLWGRCEGRWGELGVVGERGRPMAAKLLRVRRLGIRLDSLK